MYAPFSAQSQAPLEASAGWLQATLLDELAVILCVIAMAVVGLLMLGGRLPVRQGAAVVLGCFVLLGAPVIAGGFLRVGEEALGGGEVPQTFASPRLLSEPRQELPPSAFDPYAGASVRDDRQIKSKNINRGTD